MFTGIVREVGEIVKVERDATNARLHVRAALLADAEAGASVAVDGVCLTVVEREGDLCEFDVSPETASRTTLGERQAGERVNLERPLRLGDELGGHIVQGHVDGRGSVTEVSEDDGGRRLVVRIEPELARHIVEKGSVTIDGVSLTVIEAVGSTFGVALVPHTLAETTLGEARPGRVVNVEVDVLAKYVEKLMEPRLVDTRPEESGYL